MKTLKTPPNVGKYILHGWSGILLGAYQFTLKNIFMFFVGLDYMSHIQTTPSGITSRIVWVCRPKCRRLSPKIFKLNWFGFWQKTCGFVGFLFWVGHALSKVSGKFFEEIPGRNFRRHPWGLYKFLHFENCRVMNHLKNSLKLQKDFHEKQLLDLPKQLPNLPIWFIISTWDPRSPK